MPEYYCELHGVYKGSAEVCEECKEFENIMATGKKIARLEARLGLYQEAVNRIDDYSEYRMESRRDQRVVHDILNDLTERLCKVSMEG